MPDDGNDKSKENCSPEWLTAGEGEIGVSECGKGCNNDRISEYHASTEGGAATEETPWCSSFVNWCLEQAGIDGTDSKGSQSWLTWKGGCKLDKPAVGAIAVFKNRNNDGGHVAFVAGQNPKGQIIYLGG